MILEFTSLKHRNEFKTNTQKRQIMLDLILDYISGPPILRSNMSPEEILDTIHTELVRYPDYTIEFNESIYRNDEDGPNGVIAEIGSDYDYCKGTRTGYMRYERFHIMTGNWAIGKGDPCGDYCVSGDYTKDLIAIPVNAGLFRTKNNVRNQIIKRLQPKIPRPFVYSLLILQTNRGLTIPNHGIFTTDLKSAPINLEDHKLPCGKYEGAVADILLGKMKRAMLKF